MYRARTTPMREVGTTVEVDGVERNVTLVFGLYPAERRTHMHPGGPAEAELLEAVFDDTGDPLPQGMIPAADVWEFGMEALARHVDHEEACREHAADVRAERLKERRFH